MLRKSCLTLLLGMSLVLGGPATASAADLPHFADIGARPGPSKKAPGRSYFSFTLSAAGTANDSILVANLSAHSATFLLGPSRGITATSSGYAYVGAFGSCRGAQCWIKGLPRTVTLPARHQQIIPFAVRVPAGTPHRQYLAGITVQPLRGTTTRGPTTQNGIGVHAAVVHQVNVGVAVTVGNLSAFTRGLRILSVTTGGNRVSPRLFVREKNVGQTFLTAEGVAVCTGPGERHTYRFGSATILPATVATLAINLIGFHGLSARCHVSLDPGRKVTPASWTGTVRLPTNAPPHVIQTGPHQYARVPDAKIPHWAILVIGAGGAIVVALIVTIVVLLRRRPRLRAGQAA